MIFEIVIATLLFSCVITQMRPEKAKQNFGKHRSLGEHQAAIRSSVNSKNNPPCSTTIHNYNASVTLFEVLCKLGQGHFSTVYKVRKRDGIDKGCYFALKVQYADKSYADKTVAMQFEMLKYEFNIERKVQSPFLQRAYYLFKDNLAAYLVTELQSSFKDNSEICFQKKIWIQINHCIPQRLISR